MEFIQRYDSPVGTLTISSDGEHLTGLWIEGQKYFARTLEKDADEKDLPVFSGTKKWLDIYFSGKKPDFMPPLAPKGSAFQKSIWNELCSIAFGKTISYGELARKFELKNSGRHSSPRAVGGAVGHNPISIIIPCHRVLGKNGALTGYAGGTEIKKKLLQLEGISL